MPAKVLPRMDEIRICWFFGRTLVQATSVRRGRRAGRGGISIFRTRCVPWRAAFLAAETRAGLGQQATWAGLSVLPHHYRCATLGLNSLRAVNYRL
jgi:hypothetical protein